MNREEYIKFYNLKNVDNHGMNFSNSFSFTYDKYIFNFIFYFSNGKEYISLKICSHNLEYFHYHSYEMNNINDKIIMNEISKYNKFIKRKFFYKYLIYNRK